MPYEDKYCILVNEEEQYCEALDGGKVPDGWRVVGKGMGHEECLAQIEKLWKDMRPASVRREMEEWDVYRSKVQQRKKAAERQAIPTPQLEKVKRMPGSRTMQKIVKNPWILTFGDRPKAVIRLFCFPYLGGSADFVKDVQSLMPPQIEVVAVQYPGHGRRMGQAPIDHLPTFVKECSEAILPAIKGAPDYAFLGYSMGCYLSTELACYLKENHSTWPDKMVMCSQNPKFVPCTDPILDRLTDKGIIDQLTSVGGLPDALLQSPDLMKMMIPLYRADSKLSEQDEDDASRWLADLESGRQVLLDTVFYGYGGQGEREITKSSLANWGRLSSTHPKPAQLRIFEGGHFFIEKAHDLVCKMLARDILADHRKH